LGLRKRSTEAREKNIRDPKENVKSIVSLTRLEARVEENNKEIKPLPTLPFFGYPDRSVGGTRTLAATVAIAPSHVRDHLGRIIPKILRRLSA